MKKIRRGIAIVLCMILMLMDAIPVFATENSSNFSVFGDVLQRYSGSESVVTVPAGIREISSYCFENNSTVTKIIIPEGVEVIGDSAITGCSNLREIVLPNSVNTIGEYAFENNTQLTTITMPSTLSSAGYGIFLRCSSLQSINWPSGAKIPDSAFAECSSLVSVTIPEGVTEIGESAFYKTGITSLVLPQSLTKIGARCFEGSSISSITIPGSVKEIPEYAFHECKNLQNISIAEGVSTIGAWAFFGCSNLTAFPTLQSLTTIRDHAFGHSGIREMTIPNLQTLETEAFGTSSLEKVTIGGPITTIPAHCFQDSDNLRTVVLSDSIKRIEYAAFNHCDNIENINMPISLEFLGESVFSGCDKIVELKFYDAITTIERFALGGMKALKKVSLPGTVTNLSPDFMFRGVTTVVETPVDSVTYNIAKNAGYRVAAPGSTPSNTGATTNGGGASNGGNVSNQGGASANSEVISPDETVINDAIGKITEANTGDKVQLQMDSLDARVLEVLKGKDVEVTLAFDNYSWVIDGKTLVNDTYSSIDMRVTMDSNAVDTTIVEALAKDAPTKQISLAHNGEFGFEAKLLINLGSEYAGQYGNLYYYNADGKLEFQTAGEIGEDGGITLLFNHASDYVIVIDKDAHDLLEAETEMTETEEIPSLEESDGKKNSINPVVVVMIAIIVLGGAAAGGYWYWKNKIKTSDDKEIE